MVNCARNIFRFRFFTMVHQNPLWFYPGNKAKNLVKITMTTEAIDFLGSALNWDNFHLTIFIRHAYFIHYTIYDPPTKGAVYLIRNKHNLVFLAGCYLLKIFH